MFGLASGIYQSYFSTPQLTVLLLGAEGVGKTSMLERLKVTQFSNRAPVVVHATAAVAPKRTFSCPAPSNRYANAKLDQDDDEDDDEEEDHDEHSLASAAATSTIPITVKHQSDVSTTIKSKSKTNEWLEEKQQSSLEDIPDFTGASQSQSQSQPLQRNEEQLQESNQERQLHDDHQKARDNHDDDNEDELQEFNLKPGLKMLPLEKIRPTSGQNLAKVDICGAKCHVFDISGKFMDLWERYYGDADAVIFCWRLDYEEAPQRQILEMVRREIPDDVPILIFGHEYDEKQNHDSSSNNNNTNGGSSTTTTLQQQLQQQRRRHQRRQMVAHDKNNHVAMTVATELFLPNYHSNMMNAMTGSAKTGQGIREAMEWLIPLAKRQAKMRAQEAAAALHHRHHHHPTKTTTTRK